MSSFSWLVLVVMSFVIGGLLGVLWHARKIEEDFWDDVDDDDRD